MACSITCIRAAAEPSRSAFPVCLAKNGLQMSKEAWTSSGHPRHGSRARATVTRTSGAMSLKRLGLAPAHDPKALPLPVMRFCSTTPSGAAQKAWPRIGRVIRSLTAMPYVLGSVDFRPRRRGFGSTPTRLSRASTSAVILSAMVSNAGSSCDT
jgi:hypothetical protein